VFHILDHTDPRNPVYLGSHKNPRNWTDFAIINNSAYFSDRENGIVIVDLTDCPPCPADYIINGVLDFSDVIYFVSAYMNHDSIADFNEDGRFNFLDFSMFLSAVAAGCP
jgi:hypothetical protein